MTILRNTSTIKVKSGCQQSKIENFGNDRYLVNVISTNHTEVNKELKEIFSHYFGVPASKIQIISGIGDDNKILKIER